MYHLLRMVSFQFGKHLLYIIAKRILFPFDGIFFVVSTLEQLKLLFDFYLSLRSLSKKYLKIYCNFLGIAILANY